MPLPKMEGCKGQNSHQEVQSSLSLQVVALRSPSRETLGKELEASNVTFRLLIEWNNGESRIRLDTPVHITIPFSSQKTSAVIEKPLWKVYLPSLIPAYLRATCGWSVQGHEDLFSIDEDGYLTVATNPASGAFQAVLSLDHCIDRVILEFTSATTTNGSERGHRRRKRRADPQVPSSQSLPYFDRPVYVVEVPEEQPKGYPVTTIVANNPVQGGVLKYSLEAALDARSQKMFSIDETSGAISTATQLDREVLDQHFFKVTAWDSNNPQRSGTVELQIKVSDINDHEPIFEQGTYEASVRESLAIGSTVVAVRATDGDTGKNAALLYNFLNPLGENEVFRVDPATGIVSTRLPLDRERHQEYELQIQVTDEAPPASRKSATALVHIRVLDENDNYPQFVDTPETVFVSEDIDASINPVIAHISATDPDAGRNAALRYSLIGGNTEGRFSIDSLTGEVAVVEPLDYEHVRSYRLVIRAQDGGDPSKSNTTSLIVSVQDVNDNSPKFYSSVFHETVQENVPVGFPLVQVQAFDRDDGPNAELTYELDDDDGGSDVANSFKIDRKTGWIQTTQELDREVKNHYSFKVIARDSGVPPRNASAQVTVQVQDQNDNDPVFEQKVYETRVSEAASPGTPVLTVVATDKDENPRLSYEITSGNARGRFSLSTQNGEGLMSVALPLDYKQESRFVITVRATDFGGRFDTATVYINVTDANTHAPTFVGAPYTASVWEDAPVGSLVVVVSATDADVGENARITYGIRSEDAQETFAINPSTGQITTAKLLDRETRSGYLITITAQDQGVPQLSDATDVEIIVADVNDNAPVFKQPVYSASVTENSSPGLSVVQLSASDPDTHLNGQIRFTFDNGGDDGDGAFSLDATSGIVRTEVSLDREKVAEYRLVALAVDNGNPEMTSSVVIQVAVKDENDNPPLFDSDPLIFSIPENSPVGSTVGEIRAHDPDEGPNGEVEYTIIGGEDAASFTLARISGAVEVRTRLDLDYESPKKKFKFMVRASSPPLRTDVQVEVFVQDVNDNPPRLEDFKVIFNNYKNYFPTGSIGRVPAFDADVSDKLAYQIMSGNRADLLFIDADSGEIRLSPSLNTNVPIKALMEVSVSDGLNEVRASLTLEVLLVTETMLFNSLTLRLEGLTPNDFLSQLMERFKDGLSAIIPCPRDDIFLFNVRADSEVAEQHVLNVTFSARRPDMPGDIYFSQSYLRERVYLNRDTLQKISTIKVLPFDDTICFREPCLNFERCLSVFKFGNAAGFMASPSVLFRPIHPVNTFACKCPVGFTGMREHYECDTEVNLCYSNPCQNGGTCQQQESDFTCLCPNGFTGDKCEIDLKTSTCRPDFCLGGSRCTQGEQGVECANCSLGVSQEHQTSMCHLRTRSFTDDGSYLTFPGLKNRYRLRIQLSFATVAENALLLYNGRYNGQHDFIALSLVEGKVRLAYSLGGGNQAEVEAELPGGISDGKWHKVTVEYLNKTATLSLDDCDVALAIRHGDRLNMKCANRSTIVLDERCASLLATCHRFLDLTGPLHIGALPPSVKTSAEITRKGFVGCIKDLELDYAPIDMNSYVANNGTQAGCRFKGDFCRSSPCRNGAACHEGWGGFLCDCLPGFGGQDCGQDADIARQFSGDGFMIFQPTSLHRISLPWEISLSVRTKSMSAPLLVAHIEGGKQAHLEVVNGRIQFRYGADRLIGSSAVKVSDGAWHHIKMSWMKGGHVWIAIDYGLHEFTGIFTASAGKLAGLAVDRISVAGNEDTARTRGGFSGCLRDLRIDGEPSSWLSAPVERNVERRCTVPHACSDTTCPDRAVCQDSWKGHACVCDPGTVGPQCEEPCSLQPCQNGGQCQPNATDTRGYICECPEAEFTGPYCETPVPQECPSHWWGHPVCGPCSCNVAIGYDASCNKTTGQCRCESNHFQPDGEEGACLPCDCYAVGSVSNQCDQMTGQCRCRPGVIGRTCDACANRLAEVTSNGCEVIYNGCPRSFTENLWWERTLFGETAVTACPQGSRGKASRVCNSEDGWGPPDMFNCTAEDFRDLRELLERLDKSRLQLTPYAAVKSARDLKVAVENGPDLYGSDVLTSAQLLSYLIQFELQQNLNLSHRQDKEYIQNLVLTTNAILRPERAKHWTRIRNLTGAGPEVILSLLVKYGDVLTASMQDVYTNPFEVATDNIAFGLDIIDLESLLGNLNPMSPLSSLPHPAAVTPGWISQLSEESVAVVLPKYDNYLRSREHTWFRRSHLHLEFGLDRYKMKELMELQDRSRRGRRSSFPSILSLPPLSTNVHRRESTVVVAYLFIHPRVGSLMPEAYDRSIKQRWGIGLEVGSPMVSHSVYHRSTGLLAWNPQPAKKVNLQVDGFNRRSDAQCVWWKEEDSEWSKDGCRTRILGFWEYQDQNYYVECLCNNYGITGVLVDRIQAEYVLEVGLLESVATYIGLLGSLVLLGMTLFGLCVLRGGQATNSNAIHKNIVGTLWAAIFLFLIALKLRVALLMEPALCKFLAILLHYAWCSVFFWLLLEALHLYRMVSEIRDVNHGQMRIYYAFGYGGPAIVAALAVGVRAEQFGTVHFCWLSVHESAIWSMVGPICVLILSALLIFVMALRASLTFKEHVEGFGNLRTLLWLSSALLPLIGSTWILSVLSVNEGSATLHHALALSALLSGLYVFLAYCVLNRRVRTGISFGLRNLGKSIDGHHREKTSDGTSSIGPMTRRDMPSGPYHTHGPMDFRLQRALHLAGALCKFLAILLHYAWCSVFFWLLLEALHLYRMVSEIRDVNHGQMRIYYAFGYGGPAIVAALAVGVRAEQFGTVHFCWLSVHESAIWSMVGPICVLILSALLIFVMALRASLTFKVRAERHRLPCQI
ncbi:unnamed protein product [Cyprideis torosa]|uniref:Uncharacterized protein n=1 Tax=Cyprideis torosa TaxID=163714 RepID=A0A7R8ZGD1_9CRUS|nr:unnamed protein product [Cyprideis torosa]CAG0879787.1 unnamed protein product [Cyprideis torosa]